MDVIVERPAGLDLHKAQVTACVRLPGPGRERVQEVAQFTTTVAGLLTLRDWLEAHRVTQVVMEATGVYWRPVWAVLEDRFECMLVNARHVKQVPGRKTDVSDAAWLCQLLEAGLLRGSFVPPKPIRVLRTLTRSSYVKSDQLDEPPRAGRGRVCRQGRSPCVMRALRSTSAAPSVVLRTEGIPPTCSSGRRAGALRLATSAL